MACRDRKMWNQALGDIRPARLLKGGTAGDTSNSPPALSFVDRLLGRGGGASALGKPCAREAVDNRGNDIMGGYYNAKTADECCKACNGGEPPLTYHGVGFVPSQITRDWTLRAFARARFATKTNYSFFPLQVCHFEFGLALSWDALGLGRGGV